MLACADMEDEVATPPSQGFSAPPPQPPSPLARGSGGEFPYPPWAAFGLAVLLLFGYLVAQGVLSGVLAAVKVAASGALPADGAVQEAVAGELRSGAGWIFSAATLLATPLLGLAVAVTVWIGVERPPGERAPAVRRHLGLDRLPGWRATLGWLAATGLLLVAYEVVSSWAERPSIPDFMLELYTTAGSAWLLGAAVVLAAPLAEELLFRGFLLPGLAGSVPGRRGELVAVLVTAAGWAAIHAQYDVFDVTAVMLLGLLFGTARVHTRSLWLPLLLHAAVNLVAMVQLVSSLG